MMVYIFVKLVIITKNLKYNIINVNAKIIQKKHCAQLFYRISINLFSLKSVEQIQKNLM